MVGKKFEENTEFKVVEANAIPDGWMGLDVGPRAIQEIRNLLAPAVSKAILAARPTPTYPCCQKTILWNGPLGVFEWSNFRRGTVETANLLAELTRKGAVTIVGGGDSVAVCTCTCLCLLVFDVLAVMQLAVCVLMTRLLSNQVSLRA